MDPGKMLGDLAGLVALQRADEMPFEIAFGRGQGLFGALLDIVLAKGELPGLSCSQHIGQRLGLADGKQTH